nr:hypothetical protein [Ktedonobacteraceae bacterium]
MDAPWSNSLDEINAIFAHLDPRDVEQFYASYQLWVLQQHIAEVQAQIQSVTQQIAENQEHLQRVHPSAIALATLARLQSNGVNDIDLLDRMLARGEDWLDRTMQRLAYCEKFDFIRDNYTDWCEHALEGAYDWIDSMDEAQIEHGTSPSSTETPEPNTLSDAAVDAQAQTTEELLLLKLMSDEDEALMQAATLKMAAISPVKPLEDVEPTVLEQDQQQEGSTEHAPSPVQADHIPTLEELIPLESNETGIVSVEQPDESAEPVELVQAEDIPTNDVRATENDEVAEDSIVPLTPAERIEVEEPATAPVDEEMDTSSPSTTTSVPIEQVATPETSQQSNLQHVRPRPKRSFLRRLITAFLGR